MMAIALNPVVLVRFTSLKMDGLRRLRMNKEEKAIRKIAAVVNEVYESDYISNGAINAKRVKAIRSDDKPQIIVESGGYDHNYGGKVIVEASPKGKNLTVFVPPNVKVIRINE